MACSQPLKQQLGLAVSPLRHKGLSSNIPFCDKSASQPPHVWLDNVMCLFWPKSAFAKIVSFLLLPPAPYLFSRCLSVIYVGAGESGWPFLFLVHCPWLLWAEAAVAQSSCPYLGLHPPRDITALTPSCGLGRAPTDIHGSYLHPTGGNRANCL